MQSDISLRCLQSLDHHNGSGLATHGLRNRALVGLGLSSAIGYLAWRRGSLSESGALGAILTGTFTTSAGSYTHAAMLVGFFAGSTVLPKLVRPHDSDRFDAIAAKGGRRDLWQVLANGGVATVLVIAPKSSAMDLGYLAALAAVNGDTWATEIGKTSQVPPRHVLTGKQLEPGISGGISLRGTLGSIAGGAFVGAIAAAGRSFEPRFTAKPSTLLATGAVAGGLGSLVDSILGATVQERRWCPQCRMYTERLEHTCGTATRIVGGVPGVSNDVVNLGCSLAGAAIGMLIGRYLSDESRLPAVEYWRPFQRYPPPA